MGVEKILGNISLEPINYEFQSIREVEELSRPQPALLQVSTPSSTTESFLILKRNQRGGGSLAISVCSVSVSGLVQCQRAGGAQGSAQNWTLCSA